MSTININKYLNHRPISIHHVGAVAANWAIISTCILLSEHFENVVITLAAIIVIGARQHALVVMMHEAAHVHFAKNKSLNDWFANLFCAFPLTLETDVYRKVHLAHHRHLNTRQDPDLLRKEKQSGWNLPAQPRDVAWFIPAFVFIQGPREMIALLWGFSGFGTPKRFLSETRFMLLKMSYYATIAFLIYKLNLEREFLLYWFAPVLFVLPFVARVRNLSEHAVLSLENENNSSREVVPGWLEAFLLAPHDVHFHLTHHHYPQIPFFHLREAHYDLKNAGKYADAHINYSYFYPYMNSVLWDVIHGPKPKSAEEKAA